MKKIGCILLAVLLTVGLLGGCVQGNTPSAETTAARHTGPYEGAWLEGVETSTLSGHFSMDLVITELSTDCFLAETVIALPYHQATSNGKLPENWCVGDQVLVEYENYTVGDGKMEADLLSVQESTFQVEPGMCYKPVIYLYPQTETQVSVRLQLQGSLKCTYPAYQDGWYVTAAPDGTLTDDRGQTYSYLYWEGQTHARWDMEKGFCIPGADTAAFLETALAQLGLTRREANEFIVYWLPLMEQNPYNRITFQQEAYTEAAALAITPTPDTLIRVFMTWEPLESYVNLEPQELTAPERTGFTVVEWGGTRLG